MIFCVLIILQICIVGVFLPFAICLLLHPIQPIQPIFPIPLIGVHPRPKMSVLLLSFCGSDKRLFLLYYILQRQMGVENIQGGQFLTSVEGEGGGLERPNLLKDSPWS